MDPSIRSSLSFQFSSDLFFVSSELYRKYLEIMFLFGSISDLLGGQIPDLIFFFFLPQDPTQTKKILTLKNSSTGKAVSLGEVLILLNTHILFFVLFLLSKCLKTVTSVVTIKKKQAFK